MIAIVGGGVTGLSCAARLAELGEDFVLIEKDELLGGFSRSYKRNGFVFDLAGHFLHLRSDEGRALAAKFAMKFDAIERVACVRTHGARLPFPFQAHTGFLPPEANLECVLGFIAATAKKRSRQPGNFEDWILATFGDGMAKHFFFPYNRKFWKRDLKDILVDWTSWSVPRPSLEEVLRGAIGLHNEGMGYNPRFLYPKRGGMGKLIEALASRIPRKNIKLNRSLREVDASSKTVVLDNGEEIAYTALVSTAPLPRLVAMTEDCPKALKREAARLKRVVVDCAQIGIARRGAFTDHWCYVPEEKYPFYRVGIYPGKDGGTRIFVEYSRRSETPFPGEKRLVETAVKGLKTLGVISMKEKIAEAHAISLDPAYVVHDEHRKKNLPKIVAWFRKHGIHSIGRYGAWEYSSMEDGLVGGARTADLLCKKRR